MKSGLNKIIIFLGVVIIILSIGYGLYIYNFKEKTTVKSEKYDVHLENPINLKDNTASVQGLDFKTSKTTISFEIPLKNEDIYEYTIDVANDGTFDIKLNQFMYSKNKKTDDLDLCENIDYVIEWEDGKKVEIGDIISKQSKKRIKLKIENKNPSDIEGYIYSFTLNMNFIKA